MKFNDVITGLFLLEAWWECIACLSWKINCFKRVYISSIVDCFVTLVDASVETTNWFRPPYCRCAFQTGTEDSILVERKMKAPTGFL